MTRGTTYLLATLFFLFINHLSAQDKKVKIKFGKISEEEMAMSFYPEDPDAAAVVLYDKGELTHHFYSNSGFRFDFERHVRIKIFKKEALQYADLYIPFFSDEKITDLDASSYNLENGQLVETKATKGEHIFDEKITKTRRLKKITIPAVREGSIIEYRYTRTNVPYDIPSWFFQRENIPVVWSEFRASVPTFMEFSKVAQGGVPFLVAEEIPKNNSVSGMSYSSNEMLFIQEKIPALHPEPYMDAPSDYLSQINFDIRVVYKPEIQAGGNSYSYRLINGIPIETINTWEKLGAELLDEMYDDLINSGKYTKQDAASCTEGKSDWLEKTEAIYAFVGRNYQSKKDLEHIWTNEPFENIIKNKKGSPTELNLVLINMLRNASIPAYPLLISTRSNGKIIPFRVSPEAFDRLITAIEQPDSSFLLIDAAAWPHPIGLLPANDLNDQGLLLKKQYEIGWLPLKSKINSRSAFQSELLIQEDGMLSGKITFSESGYGAVKARVEVTKTNAEDYVKNKFSDLFVEGTLTSLNLENIDTWKEPNIRGAFEFNAPGLITVSGNKIYFNPSMGLGLKENPFKNPERLYPVELGYPFSQAFSLVFKIPPGYKVEEAPKSSKMTFGGNGLSFDYTTEVTPEAVRINIRRLIKETFILPEHYTDLQQFYGNIVSKLEEQIVLSKQ